jgi:6-phosphogluconolactonase
LDVELLVADDLTAQAAELLASAARSGGQIALSGGSTPKPAYELAAQLEPDWSRVELWWADDRCVPPDDERSNYRLVRETLLDRLAQPPTNVHRIQGELEPGEAARAYDRELDGVTLDLVLLGIGPDGHTASLFPNAPTLGERERRAVAAEPGLEPFVDRVTMTLPTLSSARLVLFVVSGKEKANAVAGAFADSPDRGRPASLVRSRDGRTLALLDRPAGRHLIEYVAS